ncbi:reverse transcriptase domain-containing protein [Tanacetum coccineum]
MDYSSLNKACSKDMYPFSEEGEELAPLIGYPYKCFIRLSKEYIQIRMEEDDEEKTGFHTEEGVYCFTHMSKELEKLRCYTSEDDGKGLSRSKRTKRENTLKGSSNKKQKEGIQIHVSYVSRPLQGMEICYTPMEKRVQALIHTTRSLTKIFRKHKVKVVTDGPMEEILKLSGKEGRLAKWATEVHTYDISYIARKEAEGLVMKKFFSQGEQVKRTPDTNEGGTLTLSKKLQVKSTPTPRAWR